MSFVLLINLAADESRRRREKGIPVAGQGGAYRALARTGNPYEKHGSGPTIGHIENFVLRSVANQSDAAVERDHRFSNSSADSSSNLGANRWLSANATR